MTPKTSTYVAAGNFDDPATGVHFHDVKLSGSGADGTAELVGYAVDLNTDEVIRFDVDAHHYCSAAALIGQALDSLSINTSPPTWSGDVNFA